MSPDPALQAAMIRLAYAEREGRASLAGGDYLRMHMIELVEAARKVRHAYMHVVLCGDADDLRTQPVGGGE